MKNIIIKELNEYYSALNKEVHILLDNISQIKDNITLGIHKSDYNKNLIKTLGEYGKLYKTRNKLSELEKKIKIIKNNIKFYNQNNNINDRFVTFECAKLLRDADIYIPSSAYYTNDGLLILNDFESNCQYSNVCDTVAQKDNEFIAPLLYDVQKFLIDKFHFVVNSFMKEPFVQPLSYIYYIQSPKLGLDNYSTIVSDKEYGSYEKALNEAIMEAIRRL